jgi:hypothetical protein
LTNGCSSTATAAATASRMMCAAPNRLPSTSRRSAPDTSNSPDPVTCGACTYRSVTVDTAIAATPTRISRYGARLGSRRGHSIASMTTGPTSRTSPA